MVVDFKARKAMPRKAVRGMVARTYFYMAERYALTLSKQDRRLYTACSKAYPVQKWEQARNQQIACVTGQGNRYVGLLT